MNKTENIARGGGVGGVFTNVDYNDFTPSVTNLQANNAENLHLQRIWQIYNLQ